MQMEIDMSIALNHFRENSGRLIELEDGYYGLDVSPQVGFNPTQAGLWVRQGREQYLERAWTLRAYPPIS